MALVGDVAVFVVELAKAMHLIVLPFAIVVSSVLEVEDPMPVPLPIVLVALVPTPFLNLLLHVLQLHISISPLQQGQVGVARRIVKALDLPYLIPRCGRWRYK